MNGRRRLVAAALTGAAVLTGTIAAGGCAASSAPHAVAACTVSHPTACVGIDLSRRDLRAWKFRGVDLRGANLSRANLRGVDLRGARLDRANFARADLRGADLRDAGFATAALEEADLRAAKLDGARFSAARLAGADLRGAQLGMSFWTEADLTGARGVQFDAGGVPFDGACDTILPTGVVMGCAASMAAGAPARAVPVTASARPAVDLTRLVTRLVQRDRLNPPVASRVFAYTGIALTETAQPNSLQLTGVPTIPEPPTTVDWPVVVASGAPLVPRALALVPSTKSAYASLRDDTLARLVRGVPPATARASIEYGRGIAAQVIAWAGTDGFAATRDRKYVAPVGSGLWVPTPTTFQGAQEPYWGTLRPFAVANAGQCAAPAPPTYSEAASSDFMTQERAVYDTSRRLTRDQRAIARFWADDRGRTGTPTGHWVATANIAITRRRLGLGDAARLHGVIGVAAGDAFITTWATKFQWNEIRPVTVIRKLIDPRWAPYLNTPPFPDWVSGHAAVSGAAAEVLTAIVGPMRYRDVGFGTGADVRASFSIEPRSFPSFRAAAVQAAKSREYAGIHIPASDDEGLRSGACIGHAALAARLATTK